MKIKLCVLAIGAVVTGFTMANAEPILESENTVHVFNNCKHVHQFEMNQEQREAYRGLKATEREINLLERPIKEMEARLKVHEKELDTLSGKFVVEDDDKLVVNKSQLKKHTEVAAKMEQVVAEYKDDMAILELTARSIEQKAKRFDKALQPNLTGYTSEDLQLRIGKRELGLTCS